MTGNSGVYGRHAARRYHITHKSSITDGGAKASTDTMGDILVDDSDGKVAYVDSGGLMQELS